MKEYFRNLIAYLRGACFLFFSIFRKKSKIGKGLRLFRGSSIDTCKGASCVIQRGVKIREWSTIRIRKESSLVLEEGVSVGMRNIIICHERIEIGAGTLLSPNVSIYDHNHKFDYNEIKRNEFSCSPIVIGKNCWIGANTIILKGTIVGDNCIVGAGSILNGVYPSNSVIVQKKQTDIIERGIK